MVVLKTVTTPQTFKIIPKMDDFDVLIVKDKSENTNETIVFTSETKEYFTEITGSFQLIENRDYVFYFMSGNTVSHMEKVFCTDQTAYSINNGIYEQRQTSNEFIVYE